MQYCLTGIIATNLATQIFYLLSDVKNLWTSENPQALAGPIHLVFIRESGAIVPYTDEAILLSGVALGDRLYEPPNRCAERSLESGLRIPAFICF